MKYVLRNHWFTVVYLVYAAIAYLIIPMPVAVTEASMYWSLYWLGYAFAVATYVLSHTVDRS